MLVPSGDYEKEARLLKAIAACRRWKAAWAWRISRPWTAIPSPPHSSPASSPSSRTRISRPPASSTPPTPSTKRTTGQIVSSIDDYAVPLLDMITYLQAAKMDEGYVSLERDMSEMLD